MSKILKIIIAVIGLIILWVLTLYLRRAPIERDLTERVKAALNRPEFSQVAISFEGRDGTLTGEVSSQQLADIAAELAKNVWGVRVINNQLSITAEQLTAVANLQGYFQGGKFVLSGIIPDENWRRKLIQLAEKAFGAGTIIDKLSIDASVHLPDFFEKAFAAFLGLKGINEPGFSVDPDKFVLKGKVTTDAIKMQLGNELTRALSPLRVLNNLQVVTKEASKKSLDELRAFLENAVIEFDFRSARLSNKAKEVLDRAVELIKQVPDVNIEIIGHTDNIGSHAFNMRLSESRAISIRLYLIDKGIQPERLKIKYYGETQPKASNDTEQNRQRNRRAEFKVK